MTITRALRNLAWLSVCLAACWTAQAVAQQDAAATPAVMSSVAKPAKAAVVKAVNTKAGKPASRPPVSAVKPGKVEMADANGAHAQPRLQPRARGALNQYQNAVTPPPVDSGR